MLETRMILEHGLRWVIFEGRIDGMSAKEVEKTLNTMILQGERVIGADFEKVDYVSSAGLGLIVWAKKALSRNNASFVMVNLQPQIEKLLDLMKLDEGFKIHNASEEDKYIDQIIQAELDKKNSQG